MHNLLTVFISMRFAVHSVLMVELAVIPVSVNLKRN